MAELFRTNLINDASLVNYWRFESNYADSIGTNTGTAGGTGNSFSAGKFGTGLFTNGSGYADVTSAPLQLAKFTISCWVNPSASQLSRCFLANYAATPVGIAVGINDSVNNSLKLFIAGATSTTLASSGLLTNSVWTQCVFTYDQVTMKIYINGILDSSQASTIVPTYASATARICGLPGGSQQWNGGIDDLAVFSRALTAGEVATLYNPINGFFNATQ